MEEAVSAAPDPAVLALKEAMKPGGELAPAALLAVINSDPNPTSTIDDMDRGNAHFRALQQEFGFLHVCRLTQKSPLSEDQGRLVELMRWLIREFNDWSPANDPQFRKLAALFVVTRYCDQNDAFWPEFVAHIKINPSLVQVLGRRIAGLRSQPAASTLSRTPISDGEIIGRFNTADAAADWATIASEWPRFGDHVFPDHFTSQSVRYLQGFSPDMLRQATDQVRQTVTVMLLLLALTVRDALMLAGASANPYVQFGAILRLFLQQRRRRQEKMAPDEEALLGQLLLRVTSNDTQWQAWMQALNRYPVRHPQIQNALGTALAQGPESALGPYMDAINMTATGGVGRQQVAECLRSFRATAPLPRRQELWRRAHERWSAWNFGLSEKTEHLVKIGSCELDYAVVGYAVECMDAQSRTQACNDVIARLSALPTLWHASETEFRRDVNGLLSRFQPYAYALQMGPSDDWLIEGKQFLPLDPRSDCYNAMQYKIQVP
jgi:hypothetical protein